MAEGDQAALEAAQPAGLQGGLPGLEHIRAHEAAHGVREVVLIIAPGAALVAGGGLGRGSGESEGEYDQGFHRGSFLIG